MAPFPMGSGADGGSSEMSDERPAIRVRPREDRRIRNGAPWVFSNEVVMDSSAKSVAPGSLVEVISAEGAPLACGYFNSRSLISVRLLGPTGTKIDEAFFAAHFMRAEKLRRVFCSSPFYRLINAEGDGLPGLIIDRYGEVFVVQITTAGMENLLEIIVAALDHTLTPAIILLRNDSPSRLLDGLEPYTRCVKGDLPGKIVVEENGARYFADPVKGQKSGWYYDQRDNRLFMARLGAARVLDTYCYSGGFSVLAGLMGARSVTGLDSSEPALALAAEAAVANQVAAQCHFVRCDVSAEMERLKSEGKRFDAVICDPPPFARSRKDIEPAARAYRKLARMAAGLVEPGGFMLLASCSHNVSAERFGVECALGIARAGKKAALIRSAGAATDHPVHPMLPESSYLKALIYAVA
jgi:23S rRNA (cytosine1962-C5)-methyltransferase